MMRKLLLLAASAEALGAKTVRTSKTTGDSNASAARKKTQGSVTSAKKTVKTNKGTWCGTFCKLGLAGTVAGTAGAGLFLASRPNPQDFSFVPCTGDHLQNHGGGLSQCAQDHFAEKKAPYSKCWYDEDKATGGCGIDQLKVDTNWDVNWNGPWDLEGRRVNLLKNGKDLYAHMTGSKSAANDDKSEDKTCDATGTCGADAEAQKKADAKKAEEKNAQNLKDEAAQKKAAADAEKAKEETAQKKAAADAKTKEDLAKQNKADTDAKAKAVEVARKEAEAQAEKDLKTDKTVKTDETVKADTKVAQDPKAAEEPAQQNKADTDAKDAAVQAAKEETPEAQPWVLSEEVPVAGTN